MHYGHHFDLIWNCQLFTFPCWNLSGVAPSCHTQKYAAVWSLVAFLHRIITLVSNWKLNHCPIPHNGHQQCNTVFCRGPRTYCPHATPVKRRCKAVDGRGGGATRWAFLCRCQSRWRRSMLSCSSTPGFWTIELTGAHAGTDHRSFRGAGGIGGGFWQCHHWNQDWEQPGTSNKKNSLSVRAWMFLFSSATTEIRTGSRLGRVTRKNSLPVRLGCSCLVY
jgi:hypothetical protein